MHDDRSEASDATQDLIGRRLMDRYVIGERIARGGMAVVFRGDDERLHRPVCVKVFFGFDPMQAEYAVVLEHFVQEAFALSRLTHPATLRIYDFGYLDEDARIGPYFVTEMAEGGDLGQRLAADGPLTPRQMLQILHPLVGALREAHDAGIVHRDLKPSNILFALQGEHASPKLADFSIAKASGDLPNRASDTNAAVPLYSLSWAAPEQLAEQPVGPTADVFALALVAAFVLTDQMVYPGSDIMKLYALRSEGADYREAAIRCLALPPAIEAVVLEATAEDPHDRPRSVDELYERLEAAVVASEAAELPSPPTPVSGDPHATYEDDDEETAELRWPGEPDVQIVAPPAAPVVWTPPRPTGPRLTLSSLDTRWCVIGNRRVRLHDLADGQPVTLRHALGGNPAKLRVTPMDIAPGRAHLKGLNCFVQHPAGRPSSGTDIDGSTVLALLDPQTRGRGELHIGIGTNAQGEHELPLRDVVIVVPGALARWAAVFESAAGTDTTLAFVRADTTKGHGR